MATSARSTTSRRRRWHRPARFTCAVCGDFRELYKHGPLCLGSSCTYACHGTWKTCAACAPRWVGTLNAIPPVQRMSDATLLARAGTVHPRDIVNDQERGRVGMVRGEIAERRAARLSRDIDLVAAARRAHPDEDTLGVDLVILLRNGRRVGVQVKSTHRPIGDLPSAKKRKARSGGAVILAFPFEASDHSIRKRLRKLLLETPEAPPRPATRPDLPVSLFR
jgi:hypothetical protein